MNDEFESIYEKFLKTNETNETNVTNVTNNKKGFACILLLIIFCILLFGFVKSAENKEILLLLALIDFSVAVILLKKVVENDDDYEKEYKKNIIEPLIKQKYTSSFYDTESGIDNEECEKLGFYAGYYISNSKLIVYDEKEIVINDVIDINNTNGQGNSENYYVVKMKLDKNIKSCIKIKNKMLIKGLIELFNKSDLYIDDKEFNKHFYVKTDDITEAKNILNNKTIKYLNERYKDEKYGTRYEITILNGCLYINYKPCYIVRNSKHYRNLKNIYNGINYLINMAKDINALINENEQII